MKDQNITYKEATQELEAILKAIETDAVDVDELTQKVQRSSELIKLCKAKLRTAEDAISQVFDDIECADPAASETGKTSENGEKPKTTLF